MLLPLLRRTLLGAIVLILTSCGALAEKRVALVIGNSAYQHVPSLANPSNLLPTFQRRRCDGGDVQESQF
jgi:hypothetical protein